MAKKSFLVTILGGSDLVVQAKSIVAITILEDGVNIYRKGKEVLIATNSPNDFLEGDGIVVVRPVGGAEIFVNYNFVDSLQDSSDEGCTIIFEEGCPYGTLAVEETKEFIMAEVEANSTPVASFVVGEIRAFGGEAALPSNWLICDGDELLRAEYPDLFAAIGTAYNSQIAPDVFALPDFRGRVIMGSGDSAGLTNRVTGEYVGNEAEFLSVAQLPEHDHILRAFDGNGDFAAPENALFATNEAGVDMFESGLISTPTTAMRTGTIGLTGGNTAHDNIQPSLVAVIAIYAGVQVA